MYWSLGQNLVDMINKAERESRWDVAGVGYFMKAWGWMVLTDMHGEIIVKEAIDPTRALFDYDTQEFTYTEIQRLLGLAIADLQKTDGAVDATYLGATDHIYFGDRTKWLKLAYGLQAMSLNHFTNKSTYQPAAVIAAVDKSFASNADDALLTYLGRRPRHSPTLVSWAVHATTSRLPSNAVRGEPDERHRFRRRGSAHEPHARAVGRWTVSAASTSTWPASAP